MKTRYLILCTALILGTACDKKPGQTEIPNDWQIDMPADHGTAQISPNPNPGPGPGTTSPGHSAQRMTVDQLRRSIPALFGGITWTLHRTTGTVVGFDALSRTLGEADYLTITSDNREPSPIFEKFLDDMAGNVCGQAITQDKTVPAGDQRLVIQSDTDVDQNIRFLRLKLHGLYVAPGSMDGIQDLRDLYDGCVSDNAGSTYAGWSCVCIAMLTSPELIAY